MVVTKDGRIFLCGNYDGSVLFSLDGFKFPVRLGDASPKNENSFVIEYDSDGNPLKGVSYGTFNNQIITQKITSNYSGELIIAGWVMGKPHISNAPSSTVLGKVLPTNEKYSFTAKLDSELNLIWCGFYDKS